jgi:NADH:ubiquinone oxidoreductase subunit 6 (subunit J)
MEPALIAQILFYFVAAVILASAGLVVFSRSLIYSAFGLMFTFLGVAVLYVLLGADFLAATQMVIYVGGILVLLLFGVMLTHKLYDLKLKGETFQFWPALVLMLGAFLAIVTVLLKTRWFHGDVKPAVPTTTAIGKQFLGEYILPFEIASIFLLIALIGAAMIIRRKPE